MPTKELIDILKDFIIYIQCNSDSNGRYYLDKLLERLSAFEPPSKPED